MTTLKDILSLINDTKLCIELLTSENASIIITTKEDIIKGYNNLLDRQVIKINSNYFDNKRLLEITLNY